MAPFPLRRFRQPQRPRVLRQGLRVRGIILGGAVDLFIFNVHSRNNFRNFTACLRRPQARRRVGGDRRGGKRCVESRARELRDARGDDVARDGARARMTLRGAVGHRAEAGNGGARRTLRHLGLRMAVVVLEHGARGDGGVARGGRSWGRERGNRSVSLLQSKHSHNKTVRPPSTHSLTSFIVTNNDNQAWAAGIKRYQKRAGLFLHWLAASEE